jgi:Mrp family chromosome partitioning ATPase
MERIQIAIAKARAAREGRTETRAAPPAAPRRAAPAASQDAVREAWEAIPLMDLRPARLRRHRVLSFESGQEGAEFDRLRTRMLQRMKPGGWRRVAVVSPSAQNGKSTLAANLALSLARRSHLRTMLIELDLRRPGMSPILGLPQGLDVTKVLSGEGTLPDHAVRLRENLIVAPALPMRTGSAEFLQDPDTAVALDELTEAYDPSVVLFDMPPMGAGDDVIGFLANVDCALIVAAAGVTTMKEIDLCEREVAERTEVLGLVLNKCRFEGKTEEYYDYY